MIRRLITNFLTDECGSQMQEYVIITVVSGIGGVAALKTVRDAGTAKFEEVAVTIGDTGSEGTP